MKNLQELLGRIGLTARNNPSVGGLAYDSRKVKAGDLFFAVPGFKEDGSQYVAAAKNAGAVAAVVSQAASVPDELKDFCYGVADVRRAMADASVFFQNDPSLSLACYGVTGTKGKTSSAFLLESVLQHAGLKSALAGTVLTRHPGFSEEAKRTTMESPDLQAFLHRAVQAGANAAVLEISSHALSLHRSTGIRFKGVLFTNLTADHLDFYGDMEPYFQAKLKLFIEGPAQIGVANADDSYGRRVLREAKIPVLSFGIKDGDYTMPDASASARGISGTIQCPDGAGIKIHSSLGGQFNLSNILGVAALAHACQVPIGAIEQGIAALECVPGRVERVPTKLPFQIFVDYAHMGDALENVLKSLRPACQGRLTVVFGAGGDRDPARRVQLGTVAARLADQAWITSDNPRTEDPLKIIAAVQAAFQSVKSNCRMFVEPDRRVAIEQALREAKAGDIVCIAGKGHESGQIIGTTVYPFDDRLEAARVLRELENASAI